MITAIHVHYKNTQTADGGLGIVVPPNLSEIASLMRGFLNGDIPPTSTPRSTGSSRPESTPPSSSHPPSSLQTDATNTTPSPLTVFSYIYSTVTALEELTQNSNASESTPAFVSVTVSDHLIVTVTSKSPISGAASHVISPGSPTTTTPDNIKHQQTRLGLGAIAGISVAVGGVFFCTMALALIWYLRRLRLRRRRSVSARQVYPFSGARGIAPSSLVQI